VAFRDKYSFNLEQDVNTEIAPTTTHISSVAERLDQQVHAAVAEVNSSLSLLSGWLAFLDWVAHLAVSPGKRLELTHLAFDQTRTLAGHISCGALAASRGLAPDCVEARATDRRFTAEEWHRWPFNIMQQSFLLTEQWWEAATTRVWGVSAHHERIVSFATRQLLDIFSPGNAPLTNPVVLRRSVETCGLNFLRGYLNASDNLKRVAGGQAPAGTEEFVVGRDVAVTPGKVALRNRLIELIQYTPTTEKVHPEPVLIVPAWIMKYYILDLSPHNSLIKFLIGQGHTVFCISWINPDTEDRDLGMDDYLELGFHAALDAVNAIIPGRKVHGAGYCLGGTLLAIANAAMARDGDHRLGSMTLFAAQTDFSEPGELALFIDESQISVLEAQMDETGYLTAGQMAGAFQLLRTNDLIWSRSMNEYLLGEREPMTDLMAWNADATRMPARMHGQYLRHLFLNDDLSEGRYLVGGKPVSLGDIRTPLFCVGTETDHIAPWRSVYKLHYMTPAERTFVLTSGGHNAGIVSEPGNPHRHYRIATDSIGEPDMAPDDWMNATPVRDGSWWPEWSAWLKARSAEPTVPRKTGTVARQYPVLGDAPGRNVLQK
jgi:polyhydroxyalkanoate synthase subunit PhaC